MVESLLMRLAPYLCAVLAEDGLLVFETAAKTEPELPLRVRTSRRYGAARLTLFEHEHPSRSSGGEVGLRPANADAGEGREA